MTDVDLIKSGIPVQQLERAKKDMRQWPRIRKERRIMEAARDANLPASDNEDEDPFGEKDEVPGEASSTLAGDFSVTTTTATRTCISASSMGITVNAEINPNAEFATPATFVISASQVPATPNRSMRVPEDSLLQNQMSQGNETILGTTLTSIHEEAAALTIPTDYQVEQQMEVDRQRLEEEEERKRLLGQTSDIEDEDGEDEENQQPPLTFPGTKTSILGDVPVLLATPGPTVAIPPLPPWRGSPCEPRIRPHRILKC